MNVPLGIPSVILRVRVNQERCQGHARCAMLAPELFEVDAAGATTEIGGGVVPPHLVFKADLARANCPEFAIDIDVEKNGGRS